MNKQKIKEFIIELLHRLGNTDVNKLRELPKDEQNKHLANQLGQTQEDKDAILELCQDVDAYYATRTEYEEAERQNPDLIPEEWMHQQIHQMHRQENPNATEDDTYNLETEVSRSAEVDKVIVANAEEMVEEMIEDTDEKEKEENIC